MLKIFSAEVTTRQLIKLSKQFLAVSPQLIEGKRNNSFRTIEKNPVNHTIANIGQFYHIPFEVREKIYYGGGIPKSFDKQTKTFTETCVMVREPAVDVINCLNNINFSKPTVRFVLYGKKGCGKSLTLAHLLHYAHTSGFLLVHVPWVGNWMRRYKETSNSLTKEGYIDINIDAAAWLLHFKIQNAELLKNPDLITSNEYVWSKREITEKGSHISQIVDHGINRIKFASDCIVALADEIKLLSINGVCKTFVAVDGYNAFFYPHTRIKNDKKEIVHPHKVVVTQAFLNLTKFDWKNGVCVLALDQLAIGQNDQISHLPRYLLGKDGFEHLDPFVPIHIKDYTQKELISCMDYYRDRKWVQPQQGLDDEVSFLSGNNPYNLMELCASL